MEHWLIHTLRCEVTGSWNSPTSIRTFTRSQCVSSIVRTSERQIWFGWKLENASRADAHLGVSSAISFCPVPVYQPWTGSTQNHMAVCNRWVGGRRGSKQEVIIALPAAALHLLTTWTNWKKFSYKPNISRCSLLTSPKHMHMFSYHMPRLFPFFFSFSSKELFLSLWVKGNMQNCVCLCVSTAL